MHILFQPDQKEYEIEKNENLFFAAQKAGIWIDGSCGGTGSCGKCKVKIISGLVSDPTEEEKRFLTETERKEGYRLACQTRALGDLVVETATSGKGSDRKKAMTMLPKDFIADPLIRKVHKTVKKPSMKDQRSDMDRIRDTFCDSCPEGTMETDRRVLSLVHSVLEEKKGEVTAVFSGNRLIALEPGDTEKSCYGLAVDIGTTTVVGMLWNMNSMELEAVTARTNPQGIFGADVISRIQYCNDGNNHLENIQGKILSCINEMVEEMGNKCRIDRTNIYDMTVVGNTTMTHIFLGVHPKPLARTPFAPVFCQSMTVPAKDLGISIHPEAEIFVLPNLAGHVGADLSAVLLATGLKEKKGANFAIDIGTNGEILFEKDGKILACSTAAGPAFEGASIFMGMRAAAGAIEKVWMEEDDVQVKTIENASPIGICGSGLMDAVACLLHTGLVDRTGRMLTQREALQAGISKKLVQRIQEGDKGIAFVLAYSKDGTDVILTQKDIREIQLAKGAIYAGMKTLMKMLQIEEKDLNSILMAGAFGNYIDKGSAVKIGLLPAISQEKIVSVGNAAGTGASMALLCVKCREAVKQLAKDVTHVELSVNMDFQEEYMLAMNF